MKKWTVFFRTHLGYVAGRMLGILIFLPLLALGSMDPARDCAPIPESACSAELCLLEPAGGYPRPTAWISVPDRPLSRLRIHLHGWTQNPAGQALNPAFDIPWPDGKTPSAAEILKMAMAYGMHRDVCDPASGTVLMPLSRGHVDDYRLRFKLPADFLRWKNAVTALIHPTGTLNRTPVLPWTLSAHSGGGAIAARSVDPDDFTLERILLLDATYDSATAAFFKSWIEQGRDPLKPRTLEVFSVTTPTASHSRAISLPGPAEIDGFTRTVRTPPAILVREIRNDSKFDHYSIVPARWDITLRRP